MAVSTIPIPFEAYGLAAQGYEVTDANDAKTNGWYVLSRGSSNLPINSPCIMLVARRNDFIVQIAWTIDNSKEYARHMSGNNNWLAWIERGSI